MKPVLFWDFDGTLAVSPKIWPRSVCQALLDVMPDSSITVDDIRPHTSVSYTWHTPDEDYSDLIGSKWWDHMLKKFYEIYLTLGVSEETAKLALPNIRRHILDIRHYHLYDDTILVLETLLQRGYDHYILSNNYPELEQIVRGLHLEKYFKGMVISALVGYDKPRRELFQHALQMAGNPLKAYMIGDNPVADIKGGKACGMTTVLVHREAADSGADYTIKTLTDLLSILA